MHTLSQDQIRAEDALMRERLAQSSYILSTSKENRSKFVHIITYVLGGCITWLNGSTLVDMTMEDNNGNHIVEPYTYDKWMCIYCGELFNRHPVCPTCYEDPEMREHTCEFESAIVEGNCSWSASDTNPAVHTVTQEDLRTTFLDGQSPGIPAS